MPSGRARSASLARALTRWYIRTARDLPWRKTRDPYRIWISEMMLQQTTVATVIPYYKKWIKKFPTVKILAKSTLDDVLKTWEGLGYYARARNLHKASQIIVAQHKGRVPSDPQTLLSLPGFGPYSTAAVSSIAFQTPLAVVDGNVYRVLSRLDGVLKWETKRDKVLAGIPSSPLTPSRGKHRLVGESPLRTRPASTPNERAQELLESSSADPGQFNQAMMELGALVCRPRDPQCGICPVSKFCRAYQNGAPTAFPLKAAAKKVPHYDVPVAIIRKGSKIFIQKRKPEGFLGGLWEFPGGKRQRGESLETCLKREIQEELGIDIDIQKKYPPVRHAYSMYKVTLHPFDCRQNNTTKKIQLKSATSSKWIRHNQSSLFAFPAGTHRILAGLAEK